MLRSLKTTASCIALAFAVSNVALASDHMNDRMTMVAASAPSAPSSSAPAANANQQSTDANNKVANDTQQQMAEKRKQITAEAMAAVGETRNALKALDEGKKDEALAALEKTTGKLELILARDPQLTLAPTNVSEITTSILADAAKVRQIRSTAEELLVAGQVQAARHLLEALASETVISVSNIPLGTYPDAIKQAAKLIDDGKQDQAKTVLQTALNTLVVTNTIIPLPVVATQSLLKDAETLAEKKDRSFDENKKLNDLLAASRTQLEFAEVLGYGTRQDFKDLYAELDTIRSKTSDGKSGTGFFNDITHSLTGLFQTSQQTNGNQPTAGQAAAAAQPAPATATAN
jgi:hypothetical protein